MDVIAALRELVSSESPSRDVAAVTACADTVARVGHAVSGTPPQRVEVADGPPALAWRRGEASAPNRVLLLGHLDTVWPLGTLRDRPFLVTDGRATGPGVFDMKAGLVIGFAALAELDPALPVTFLVTGDEELGSPSSRRLIEHEAASAQAALVLEGAADGGAFKAARKGLSIYRLLVRGRAAHAGLEPEKGRNALLAMARLVEVIGTLAAPGTTVTPTLARAGETANTVPDRAELTVDVRAPTIAEQQRVDTAIRALAQAEGGVELGAGTEVDAGTAGTAGTTGIEVTVEGGVNRPPMERQHAEPLLRRLAALPPGDHRAVAVGGVSDGNLTAALDVPTLDGLGAVGGGAHADHEWVDLAATTARIPLLASLISDLVARPLTGPAPVPGSAPVIGPAASAVAAEPAGHDPHKENTDE